MDSGLGVYNGTDWYLLSVDLNLSVSRANGTEESRKFRLYPIKGNEAVVRPFTTAEVDTTDLVRWLAGTNDKVLKREFVHAEGYRE